MEPNKNKPLPDLEMLIRQHSCPSHSVMSLMVSSYAELSDVERRFLGEHLPTCQKCRVTFAEVFDSMLECDPATEARPCLTHRDKDRWVFQAGELLGRLEAGGVRFQTLPDGIQRLQISDGQTVWLRLLEVRKEETYALDPDSIGEPLHDQLRISYLRDSLTHSQSSNGWVRLAVAALVLLGLATLIWRMGPVDKPLPITKKTLPPVEDSVPAKQVEEPRKEPMKTVRTFAFEPNAQLEAFVNRNVRSEGLQILVPANDMNLENPVTFTWQSGEETPALTVTVVDNKNREVWKTETTETRVTVSTSLRPGLYYWFLRSQNEVAHVGKFVIR